MESTSQKICKKCLLRDLDMNKYYESVQRAIAALDKRERTPDDEYEKRLALCRECPKLFEATCGACGCYVELRAAKRSSHCPDAPSKW